MKNKLLKNINEFHHLCHMAMRIDAGNFAKENFPKIIEENWDDKKTDKENLKAVKDLFETNRKLNETIGNPEAAKVIAAFQECWLYKL